MPQYDEKMRSGLRELVSRVEDYYLDGEGKISFGDLLKLIQRKDLDRKLNPPKHVQAQWVDPDRSKAA